MKGLVYSGALPWSRRVGILRPKGLARVGQVTYHHQELMVAMNVLDGVLRPPLPFAHLLEAVGHAALKRTGQVPARRVGLVRRRARSLHPPA